MALPQPTNVPRIIEVLDPGANQLSVEVRMPPQLASKYPDKAWGTAIDTIGLQKKDSDRFVGYTLVDIQPMRDSDDLKWIFEKLSGPVWTTTTVGSENIIPEKFRSQVSQTKTKQEVAPGTSPSAITGDLISSTVEAQENTGKAVKMDVSETIDASATAMVSPSLEDQLYVTTEILVAEGTLPDTGTGVVESTVQAIGKGKAVKTSKFAVTAYTNKTTYTVGYASLLNENVGSADSIPAKFRALKSLKTWRLRVQASAPPSTPALGVGSGAYSGYDIVERAVKQTQENGSTDVFELVIVGLSNTGDKALDSTTYGKIVTTTTTETLDLSAQTIDTGLAVISSMVEELGNGMTLKSTEQVQGGEWPDPVEQEIVSDATKQPPARYLRDLIRTTVKKMVSAVGSGTLTGNQVAKSYKRETPDRVAETVTTEELNLTLTAIDSGVQQKPFVTITEVMTPGPAKVLPTNRSGSAKLVYEQGTTQIWENTEEVAVAREGSAGKDKDKKPFVEITTDKRYSTSDTIATASGSANIVFNDGTTQVYEISETTSTGRYGAAGAEQQIKPFVKITSTKTYEPSGVLPGDAVGSSNKVYDDGLTEVYEQSVETSVARESTAGTEKDVKPFVSIATAKKYSADPTVATLTGSANVVFNDGTVQVYEVSEVTATARPGSAGVEQQAKPFVKITSTATYETEGTLDTGEVGSTNKIYDDGTTTVYEKKVDTAVAVSGPAGAEKDEKPFVTITTEKKYADNAAIATPTGSANIVFNDGAVQVYEVNEVTAVAKPGPAGSEQQAKPFVKITSAKTYESSGLLGAGEVGSTNKIYDDGTVEVYEKSVETAVARETSAGTEKDKKPFVSIETAKKYSANSAISTETGSANVVFNDGTVQVYEVNEVTSTGRYGAAGTETDQKPFVKLQTVKTYEATDNLGANEIGATNKIYDDGTTEVYEKSVVNATARPGPAGSEQQSKPFVKITSTSTYETSDALGAEEIGITNKIYDDGTTTVYEKKVDTAVARETTAGTDKDVKPFVSIATAKKYSANPTVATLTGSANVVFNDGAVQVYEVSEVTATARPGSAGTETDQKPFVKLQTVKTYEATDNLGANEIGATNKIYDDGTTEVYEKNVVNATARETSAGKDVDTKPFVKITTNKRYSASDTIVTPTGSANTIFNDGTTKVYEVNEVVPTGKFGPAGFEKEHRLGYRLEHEDTYVASSDVADGIGETVIAYTDGQVTVWKKRKTTVFPVDKTFIVARKTTKTYRRTVTAKYATSPDSAEEIYESEVVFSDGTNTIYKIEYVDMVPLPPHTYDTYVRADRPSELIRFDWSEVQKKDEWLQDHNDRDLYLIRPYIKEGYSGLFPAKITEYFTLDPHAANGFVPVTFTPEPIHYDGMKYNVSVGPTLHTQVVLADVITEIAAGPTPDPMYDYGREPVAAYRTFDATVPTAVPSGYVNFAIDVEPFETGFIVREIKVKYKD